MVTWQQFALAAPDLADAGQRLFTADGIGWLATVRRDGAPRLHAIVPIFAAGQISVFVNAQSPKRHELLRGGHYALHAPLGPSDEEFSILGQATLITDAATRAAVIAAAGHTIRPNDLLFAFNIERCMWAIWENVGQPDTRPVRRRWDAPAD